MDSSSNKSDGIGGREEEEEYGDGGGDDVDDDGDYYGDDVDYNQDYEDGLDTEVSNNYNSNINIVPEGKYELLEYSDVMPVLGRLVRQTNEVEYVGLDIDATEVLLQMSKWNSERLLDDILNNRDLVISKAGLNRYDPDVILPRLQSSNMDADTSASGGSGGGGVVLGVGGRGSLSDTEDLTQCKICYEYFDETGMFALGCNHWFCSGCYKYFLHTQIDEGPSCILTVCPQFKCYERVTSSVFRQLCSRDYFDKYRVFMSKNFIECSKKMRYCPNPLCNKVAIGSGINYVDCSCKTSYCFKCGENRHDPCSCAQLTYWNSKCKDESETTNWIIANTQKCPKCQSRIEKNQGCNHMICKICKHDFCWVCSGPWSEHGQNTGGYYKCNKFEVKPEKGKDAKEKAKVELERYIHYFSRYSSSLQAEKFAATQKISEIAKIYRASQTNYNDQQYKIQALESVIRCRQVLKYTYIVGYNLADGMPEKTLFEHHQEMLEKNTERLQALTDAFDRAANTDRSEIINLNRATESFLNNLLDLNYNDIMDGSSRVVSSSSNGGGGGGGVDK